MANAIIRKQHKLNVSIMPTSDVNNAITNMFRRNMFP